MGCLRIATCVRACVRSSFNFPGKFGNVCAGWSGCSEMEFPLRIIMKASKQTLSLHVKHIKETKKVLNMAVSDPQDKN